MVRSASKAAFHHSRSHRVIHQGEERFVQLKRDVELWGREPHDDEGLPTEDEPPTIFVYWCVPSPEGRSPSTIDRKSGRLRDRMKSEYERKWRVVCRY